MPGREPAQSGGGGGAGGGRGGKPAAARRRPTPASAPLLTAPEGTGESPCLATPGRWTGQTRRQRPWRLRPATVLRVEAASRVPWALLYIRCSGSGCRTRTRPPARRRGRAMSGAPRRVRRVKQAAAPASGRTSSRSRAPVRASAATAAYGAAPSAAAPAARRRPVRATGAERGPSPSIPSGQGSAPVVTRAAARPASARRDRRSSS